MSEATCADHEARIRQLEATSSSHSTAVLEIVQRLTDVENSARSAHKRTTEEREARERFESTVTAQLGAMQGKLDKMDTRIDMVQQQMVDVRRDTQAAGEKVEAVKASMATLMEDGHQAKIREAKRDKKLSLLLKLTCACVILTGVLVGVMLWRGWMSTSEIIDAVKVGITAATVII